jgi:hypothetical protein
MNTIFSESANFTIYPASGKKELYKKLDMPKVEEYAYRKIIGIFDFDGAYNDFNGLSSLRWSDIHGRKEDCLYKYRIDSPNIHAIMIPVPNIRKTYVTLNGDNNHLIVEHLFDDKTLKKIKHFDHNKDIGGGGKIVKIKNKINLWQSAIKLNEDAFSNFKPLFDRINKIIT